LLETRWRRLCLVAVDKRRVACSRVA
jgi:hypothetical protein